jgi:hypothetical protein
MAEFASFPMRMRQISLFESFLAFSEANRAWFYTIAAACVAIIGWFDWLVENVSLGFLYIVPILLASATLRRPQLLISATLFDLLRRRVCHGRILRLRT